MTRCTTRASTDSYAGAIGTSVMLVCDLSEGHPRGHFDSVENWEWHEDLLPSHWLVTKYVTPLDAFGYVL